jgi:uncharacterized membrane protein
MLAFPKKLASPSRVPYDKQMNAAQLHLLLNHLPVLVPVIGILLISVGLLLKTSEVRNAGAWLIFFGALSAVPVYLTGNPTSDILKNYPGASRLLIEDHQSSALTSLIILEITGIVSMIVVYMTRAKKTFSKQSWPWILLVGLSLISFGFMARTAHLGGLIRHEEIRSGDRF